MNLEQFLNDIRNGIIPKEFDHINYTSPAIVQEIDDTINIIKNHYIGTVYFPDFDSLKNTLRALILRKARETVITMQNDSFKSVMDRIQNLHSGSTALFPYSQAITEQERSKYPAGTSVLEIVVNKFEECYRNGSYTDCANIRAVLGNHQAAIFKALDEDYTFAEDLVNFWALYDRKIRPVKAIKIAQKMSQNINMLRNKVTKIISFNPTF